MTDPAPDPAGAPIPRTGSPASIRHRLLWPLSIILLLGSVGLAGIAAHYSRLGADSAYDVLLTGAAYAIVERVAVENGQVTVDVPVAAFDILSPARDDRVFYRVIGPDGGTITGYDGLAAAPKPPEEGMVGFHITRMYGETVRVATVRRRLAERAVSGPVTVMVAQTIDTRMALVGTLWRGAVVGIVAVGLAMLGLAWWAVGTALKPLIAIDDALSAKDARDLTPLRVETPRELTHTVGAINLFLTRIRGQVAAGQDFMADVSHQLRTALTAIRTLSESARDEEDPARLRRIAERIHRRSVGLGRMTTQILNRAMVIHRADSVGLEPLDLRAVAVEVVDDEADALAVAEDGAGDGASALRLTIPDDPVPVHGDSVSLGEAVRNLLHNARRHGVPPVELMVREDSAAGMAELIIRDRGRGIPEESWPGLGERFRHGRSVDAESAGLGLAIVRAVAVAHDGRLIIRRDAEGFEIGLALPITGEES